MHRSLLPWGLVSSFALFGCGAGGLEVGFEAGELVASSGLQLSRFELQVRELKVLPDNKDVDEKLDKFKAKGEFHLDVLDPADSTLPGVDLEDGNYKKVEFKIDKPDTGEGIDGTEAALLLEGSKDSTAFRLLVKKIDKVTVRDQTGITLPDDADSIFVVDLGVAGWFDGVDLTGLSDVNGVVLLDEVNNKSPHAAVVDNIKSAIKLIKKKQ